MPPVYSCLHCQFLSHVLKSLFFNQNSPKMKLFLQKNAKFSSAGGSAPRPPCLRRLEALPPNPHPPNPNPNPHWPPAAGGSAPDPPNSPPHCEFLATRLHIRHTGNWCSLTFSINLSYRYNANTIYQFIQHVNGNLK